MDLRVDMLVFRWVHEYLNVSNKGLDMLLDYLKTSLEVMR